MHSIWLNVYPFIILSQVTSKFVIVTFSYLRNPKTNISCAYHAKISGNFIGGLMRWSAMQTTNIWKIPKRKNWNVYIRNSRNKHCCKDNAAVVSSWKWFRCAWEQCDWCYLWACLPLASLNRNVWLVQRLNKCLVGASPNYGTRKFEGLAATDG